MHFCLQYENIILPIMLALLSGTYFAQDYASIIGWCLIMAHLYNLWKNSTTVLTVVINAVFSIDVTRNYVRVIIGKSI